MTDDRIRRWQEVLDNLARMLPAGPAAVLVDGAPSHARMLADRLADTLHATGRPCARLGSATPAVDEDAWHADRTTTTVALADGPLWRDHPPAGAWDLTV